MLSALFRERYISFKLFSVNSYLQLLIHYEIREDVLEMYRACVIVMMQTPELKRRTAWGTGTWFKRAFHFGEVAQGIDPHKQVVEKCENLVENINILESIHSKFHHILLLAMFVFGISSIFGTLYSKTTSMIFLIAFLTLFLLKCVLIFYQKVLFTDTEMLQKINSGLILNYKDLSAIRGQKACLISANVWNHSLCKYDTALFLFSLLLLKIILRPIYSRTLYHIKRDFSRFMPTFLENKDKRALRQYLWKKMFPKS
jgi:hypothetical protein